MRKISLSLTCVLFLQACVTTGPYVPPPKNEPVAFIQFNLDRGSSPFAFNTNTLSIGELGENSCITEKYAINKDSVDRNGLFRVRAKQEIVLDTTITRFNKYCRRIMAVSLDEGKYYRLGFDFYHRSCQINMLEIRKEDGKEKTVRPVPFRSLDAKEKICIFEAENDKFIRKKSTKLQAKDFQLVDLLLDRDYAASLQTLKQKYHLAQQNKRKEKQLIEELDSLFYMVSISGNDVIDQFVETYPMEALAWLARGLYYSDFAKIVRGECSTGFTSIQRFDKMRELQEKAIHDFDKALRLDPDLYIAYAELADIYTLQEEQDLKKNYFTKALEINPSSFFTWNLRLMRSAPRWGGSFELMENLIEEMKPLIEDNPSLYKLQGHLLFEKGVEEEKRRYKIDAIKFYEKSLKKYGENARTLHQIGFVNASIGFLSLNPMDNERYKLGCEQMQEAIGLAKIKKLYQEDYDFICSRHELYEEDL